MKRKYIEMSCDYCMQADYYAPGFVDQSARDNGWIITRAGEHFCDENCRNKHRARQLPPRAREQE